VQQENELLLQTRTKGKIPNELRPERPKIALDASVELWKNYRPDALLRSLTATYNCIGLVVASRRAWVDPEHLLRVLQEDGYTKLTKAAEAQKGDVVVYRDDDGEVCHAGIVVGKNILTEGGKQDALRVLSKWGADGEYEHDLSYVPALLGKAVEFWTDRRNV
jgi:hypothetical protein